MSASPELNPYPPKTIIENAQANDETGLNEIKTLTAMMRQHADDINRLASKRRATVLRLREQKVTYRELAEAMGVSEVTVYKVIRGEG